MSWVPAEAPRAHGSARWVAVLPAPATAPLVSVTLAHPSHPASNPSWSTNVLESAQPLEASLRLLDTPYNNSQAVV